MKVVVISGGTSGIGKSLAKLFNNNGCKVLTFGRTALEEECKVDITNEEQVEKFFKFVKSKYGKIDILINNAGYGLSGSAELANFNEVKNLFNVNYFGALKCVQCALPMMNSGSKIINISSCCAIFPMPFRIHYCASKSALSMLSYGLKMELINSKIQVTTINPGDIKTNFINSRIKNFDTNDKYGDRVKNAQALVEKNNSKRMTQEYASKKIFKIINKKRLKSMYIIGRKYKIFNFFIKIMPINFFLKIINKIFGGSKKL